MNITICGGGNLGHVVAGFLGSQRGQNISILTTYPEKWSQNIEVVDNKGEIFRGCPVSISSSPKDVIPNADVVLLCLPGFAIRDMLRAIEPYLTPNIWVGSIVSSTGFFFEAFSILTNNQPLFGFQRVPFISRIIEYGHRAELKGYKDSLSVAVMNVDDKEYIRKTLEVLFKTRTFLLNSFYEASLSNSNPLLHTARLYTMWKDWKPGLSYDVNPGFYSEWTVASSLLYLSMDDEFQKLLRIIGVQEGAIPSVLDYYECSDANSLTKKIRTIQAFQGILSPMTVNNQGRFEPDFSSRYFIEDFPYGLRYIIETAEKHNFDSPIMKEVYQWGMNMCNGNKMQ